jgi:hypothetical protein
MAGLASMLAERKPAGRNQRLALRAVGPTYSYLIELNIRP